MNTKNHTIVGIIAVVVLLSLVVATFIVSSISEKKALEEQAKYEEEHAGDPSEIDNNDEPAADQADEASAPNQAEAPAPAVNKESDTAVLPPVKSVKDSLFQNGSRFTYRFDQILKTAEGPKVDVSYVNCDVQTRESPQTPNAFTMKCQEPARIGNSTPNLWGNQTVYDRRPDGIWIIEEQNPPKDEFGMVLPVPRMLFPAIPDPVAFTKSEARGFDLSQNIWCNTVPGSGTDQTTPTVPPVSVCFNQDEGPVSLVRTSRGRGYADEAWTQIVISPTPSVEYTTSTEVDSAIKAIIDQWINAQNMGDFNQYKALYSDSFKGIRRAGNLKKEMNAAEWQSYRGKMFEKPMTVVASNIKVNPMFTGIRVLFDQFWQGGSYADQGPKEIVISNDPQHKIIFEEMIHSSKVPLIMTAVVTNTSKSPEEPWLSLRATPKTGEVLAKLTDGTEVRRLGTAKNKWVEIEVTSGSDLGKTGWAFEDYLKATIVEPEVIGN